MARGKAHGFSRVATGTGGTYQVTMGMALQNSSFFSVTSGLLSSCDGHLGFSSWLCRAIGMTLEVRQET